MGGIFIPGGLLRLQHNGPQSEYSKFYVIFNSPSKIIVFSVTS